MNQNNFSALKQLINSDYGNMAGIVVQSGGLTVFEEYFNGCTAATGLHVFSVTKSIVSLLIGIAIDKGLIKSVEAKVLDFFPHYTPKRGEKTLQTVTLKHLLTMTAPYKYKAAPLTKTFSSSDWVKAALDLLGGNSPAGSFRYTPLIGPDILTGILAAVTKKSPLEFARECLFAPLGINIGGNITFSGKEEQMAWYKAKDVSGWVADPQGNNTAGWGLCLSAIDMAKIGHLVLNGGKWGDKQIVSAEWLAESTKEHSRWQELSLPYGYLWWLPARNTCAALGDGGNAIYVNPDKQLVVAIASLFVPSAKDRIELIQKHIESVL